MGLEQIKFDFSFLKAVLVGSAFDGHVPQESPWILNEFSNGVVDYLCGQGGEVVYGNWDSDKFRLDNSRYVQDVLDLSGEELNPRVLEFTSRMIKPKQIGDSRSGVGLMTELEELYCGHDCGLRPSPHLRSTVDIKYFLALSRFPSLEEELEDIKGISEAMNPFVEKDVRYIRENYIW